MDEERLKKLHLFLSKKGVITDDYDTFVSKYKNESDRRSLYRALSNRKMIGSVTYDQFSSIWGVGSGERLSSEKPKKKKNKLVYKIQEIIYQMPLSQLRTRILNLLSINLKLKLS